MLFFGSSRSAPAPDSKSDIGPDQQPTVPEGKVRVGEVLFKSDLVTPISGHLNERLDFSIGVARGLEKLQIGAEFEVGKFTVNFFGSNSYGYSRRHVGIRALSDTEFEIRDLGSKCGTHYLIPGAEKWAILTGEGVKVPSGTIVRTDKLDRQHAVWFQVGNLEFLSSSRPAAMF